MSQSPKITGWKKRQLVWLAVMFAAGVLAYHLSLEFGGKAVIDQAAVSRLERQVEQLQDENDELFEELLRRKPDYDLLIDPENLPYDGEADARAIVAEARARAGREGKFLMVTFGANWCLDCRNLHHQLNSEVVKSYTEGRFLFVNVDVGKFNQNADLAEELGVSLSRGIPVAIFFDRAGQVIGTTNQGELEPARHYTSRQILRFVRDVAERSRILAPDAVQ